jgi:hypothetical protein
MSRAGLALLAAALVVTGGCGGTFDVVYLFDDGRFHTWDEQRVPTGVEDTRIAYTARVDESKAMRLVCETETRSIDRVRTVTRTYQRRGGYEGFHMAAMFLDGIIGGVITGLVLHSCLEEGSDTSCKHLYWAVPFGVDFVYSAVRIPTVHTPKLIDKQYSEYREQQSAPARAAAACAPEAALVVGQAVDHPLALRLAVASDGTLDAEAQARLLRALVEDREAKVHAVAPDGTATPASFDRCGYLRAHASTDEALAPSIDEQCPAPKPAEAPVEQPAAEPTEQPAAEPTEQPAAEPAEQP